MRNMRSIIEFPRVHKELADDTTKRVQVQGDSVPFSLRPLLELLLDKTETQQVMGVTPSILISQFILTESLRAKADIGTLLGILKEAHPLVKRRAALQLGRLGARRALPLLRHLENQSCDPVNPCGHYAVAIKLIEARDRLAQKEILLSLACGNSEREEIPPCVMDEAGRELSRFSGKEIAERLKDIPTSGAQYAVLKHQCNRLSRIKAIALCVTTFEEHASPQKSDAAEELLAEYGSAARRQLERLMIRLNSRPDRNLKAMMAKNRCEGLIQWIKLGSESALFRETKADDRLPMEVFRSNQRRRTPCSRESGFAGLPLARFGAY